MSDSYEYDEEEYGVGDEENYDEVDGPIEAVDDTQHLQDEDMDGLKTMVLTLQIVGSPNELQAGTGTIDVSGIEQCNHHHLKRITSRTNRQNATDADRVGDLAQTVIVDANFVTVQSTYPFAVGIDCSDMVPMNITSNNAFTWTIEPNTGLTVLNQNVYEPADFFTRQMCERANSCTAAALAAQVNFDMEPDRVYVNRNGIFMWQINNNIDLGRFGRNGHALRRAIDDNARTEQTLVSLPRRLVEPLYESVRAKCIDHEKSFVDLRKFSAEWSRTDGRAWNSSEGLVGAVVNRENGYDQTNALNTVGMATVKLRLKFFSYPSADDIATK